MSLSSLAVRICTVEALRGATFAGDAIEDSPVDAIALAIAATAPLVTVFSDRESFKGDGLSFFMPAGVESAHTLDLTFNIFLPTEMAITIGDVGPVGIEVRNSGGAMAVDLFYRQIEQALAVAETPWAALWRRCCLKINSVDATAYVLTTDKGLRLPAREITLGLDIIDSPEPGGGASSFWSDFLVAVRASDDLAHLGDMIAAAIEGEPLPEWRRLQALLGLTRGEVAAIGEGPTAGDGDDVPMEADDFAIEGIPDTGAAIAALEP